MEEIKVGEYVRTADGAIGKLEQINKEPTDDTVTYIVTDIFCGMIEEIVNHSFNLIDLIEVGDYVNGHRVLCVNKYDVEVESNSINADIWEKISIGNIKSIVTKQQFQSVQYTIEKGDE